jgi:hypothetical protein
MKIRPVDAKMFHADGQTDMMKLTLTFRNFAKAPKNSSEIWAWDDRAKIRTDAAKIKSFISLTGY